MMSAQANYYKSPLSENVPSDHMRAAKAQIRLRVHCADAQSHRGLHWPLTESLYTTECMTAEQVKKCVFEHVQNAHISGHPAHL